MKIIESVSSLKEYISSVKMNKQRIGFVPTMGALHQGHVSLVKRAREENEVVIVSIFVNPTQFNDKKDLENYPRTMEKDFQNLEQEDVSAVFAPSVQEMYPIPDTRQFDFGNLDKVMEGKHRQGHFNGVAQVVSKLFEIVQPNNAYFGQKDFQQVTIIKKLASMMNLPIAIVSCPIIREADGLAMSSRNMLLTPEQRKAAPLIYQTLVEATQHTNQRNVHDTIDWVIKTINANPLFNVEYFEIVDDVNLEEIKDWMENKNKVGCITVKLGNIRLIDNIKFNS